MTDPDSPPGTTLPKPWPWLESLAGFDWLFVLLASWLVPLGFVPAIKATYFSSLLLWAIPVAVLLPRFFSLTHPGSRRRRALGWSTIYILVLGVLLDLVFGHQILQFDSRVSGTYIGLYLPGIGMDVPIEEMLFYLFSFPAILLVYFWFDEFRLTRYNSRALRLGASASVPVIRVSGAILLWGAASFVGGVLLKLHWSGGAGWVPKYYTFLLVTGLLPAALVYRTVRDLVNWPAFAFTSLFVFGTSILWEVTLAIPNRWWGYRSEAMLGKMIDVWTRDPSWPLPVEALLVWIAAPFACIFTYEAVKSYHYNPNPSKLSRVLPEDLVQRFRRVPEVSGP